jgi:Ni/Fe-hydrogenase subunit HybB-like protein
MLFLAEAAIHLAAAGILLQAGLRARPDWQARAGMLLLLGGIMFRFDTYMVAFNPGPNWSYFPAVPELLVTFGIIAAEAAVYVWAVKTFPILGGAVAPARNLGVTQ